jgi:ATP-dependent protease HslVU (ClpYQ) peptidase subunit
MTTILTFRFANGRVIVADRANTLTSSVATTNKLDVLSDKTVFCGAGSTAIIKDIKLEIANNSHADLIDVIQKIIDKKREKIEVYRSATDSSTVDIENTEFLIIDKNSLEGFKTIAFERNPIDQIDAIGSGSEALGLVQEELGRIGGLSLEENSYGEQLGIIRGKALWSLEMISRSDPHTGHPAVFGADMWIVFDGRIRKYRISFAYDVHLPENYTQTEVA